MPGPAGPAGPDRSRRPLPTLKRRFPKTPQERFSRDFTGMSLPNPANPAKHHFGFRLAAINCLIRLASAATWQLEATRSRLQTAAAHREAASWPSGHPMKTNAQRQAAWRRRNPQKAAMRYWRKSLARLASHCPDRALALALRDTLTGRAARSCAGTNPPANQPRRAHGPARWQ